LKASANIASKISGSSSSYEDGHADYAEYLHLALARTADALPFLTFDEKASKAAGARLLA
jgi:predicted nucleic-acid-binding protein